MAIQLPNPGLGDGQTGDNEYVMWTKVKDNFSNTGHAASRLVGIRSSDLVQASDVVSAFYDIRTSIVTNTSTNLIEVPRGVYSGGWRGNPYSPRDAVWGAETSDTLGVIEIPCPYGGLDSTDRRMWAYGSSGDVYYFNLKSGRKWAKLYTTENTTKEDDTGYLVASSPVLKMQHDSFEKVHEAEQLDISTKHIKTGVYEITGTTGLREGDGWNLKPPKDVNGNVLCICEATESNGVITLKTYKKKFDFETVSIVADYEQPTDIPEGATVMLRFNDLPQEQLDESIE